MQNANRTPGDTGDEHSAHGGQERGKEEESSNGQSCGGGDERDSSQGSSGGGAERDEEDNGQAEQTGGSEHHATILERIVGITGAALVLGVIGFLFHQAFWGDESPPNIEAGLVRVVPSGDDWLAEIIVTNLGGETAAQVSIVGRLTPPGMPGQPETATVTIDYVPSGSVVQAGLYFDERPTADTLQLDVGGYARP